MASGKPFREVELPQQKSYEDGVLFPVVLSPNTITESTATELSALEDAIKANKKWLESLLINRGAILFRGFPVINPSDFNKVIEAFDFPELVYIGGAAHRTQVVGRVFTANESPVDKQIPFHHEMAYVPEPPTKLFFYCDEEPEEGGETPIVLSHIVYEKMKEKHPVFVAKLEEHGLNYWKIARDDGDPSSYNNGISWKSIYKTDDKSIAEERAAKQGSTLEWMGDAVKIISNPLPAIRFDEESRRKTWFNSLVVSYSGPATKHLGNKNTFAEVGNGDPVDDDAVKDLLKILEEECVAVPWKKGDVMLVNNFTVLHSRRPLIKPPRRILASLCK